MEWGLHCRSGFVNQPEMGGWGGRGEREKADQSGSSTDRLDYPGASGSCTSSLSFLICKNKDNNPCPAFLAGFLRASNGRKGGRALYGLGRAKKADLWVGSYYLGLHADPSHAGLGPTR